MHYRVCIDAVPQYNCYYITTGFESMYAENYIDFRHIRIWNVILVLTYCFDCEKISIINYLFITSSKL